MKKGFTLLELVVVIVIIGILATLGIATYTRMIERARGAEARQVLGTIRTQVAALYIGNNNKLPSTLTNDMVGIGTATGQISSTCSNSGSGLQYYFSYSISRGSDTSFTGTATRCTGTSGKQPGGPSATTLTLVTDFSSGSDTWGGSGGY